MSIKAEQIVQGGRPHPSSDILHHPLGRGDEGSKTIPERGEKRLNYLFLIAAPQGTRRMRDVGSSRPPTYSPGARARRLTRPNASFGACMSGPALSRYSSGRQASGRRFSFITSPTTWQPGRSSLASRRPGRSGSSTWISRATTISSPTI